MSTTGRIGLGTASIGGLYEELDDHTAEATLEAAWEAGTRYFDTAPHYGAGVAERRLGAFLRERPRHEFTVSTPAEVEANAAHAGAEIPDTLWAELDELAAAW